MAQLLNEFLTWCGIVATPTDFISLVQWFVTVLIAISVLCVVIKLMYKASSSVSRLF